MRAGTLRITGCLMALVLFLAPAPLTLLSTSSHSPDSESARSNGVQSAESREIELRLAVSEEEAVGNWSVDQNFHSRTDRGGLWVGLDAEAQLARSYMKFHLHSLWDPSAIESARLVAYMSGNLGVEDIPIGIHYVSDDTWSETSITWANQPQHTIEATSVIDTPESPDMFVTGNSYSWNITNLVKTEVNGDKTLSLMLKLTDELCPVQRGAVFTEDEYYHFNATYIAVVCRTPEALNLAVNGNQDGLLVEYLQDPNPLLAWSFNDSYVGDYQTDFRLGVYSTPEFQSPGLLVSGCPSLHTVFTGCTTSTTEPFSRSNQMRIQYKYLSSLLNVSGAVDTLRFEVDTNETTVTFQNLVVTLAGTKTAGDLGPLFMDNYGTAVQTEVLRAEAIDVPVVNGTLEIDVSNGFVLGQDMNLIIELRYTNCSGGTVLSRYTPNTGLGSVAYTWGEGVWGEAYVEPDAFYRYPYCFGLEIVLETESLTSWNSSAATTGIPFALPSNSSGTLQMKWNESYFDEGGLIDKIYFHVNDTSTDVGFENLTVILAESNLEGRLNHSDLAANLDVASAMVVLEAEEVILPNHGGVLVLDVENEFGFDGTTGLLIQMSWDGISGAAGAYISSSGRACWNYTNVVQQGNENVTWSPEVAFDFIHSETSSVYSGLSLPEQEYVYWRVAVRDASGFWSEWSVNSFKYHPIVVGPTYSDLSVNPDPVTVNEDVVIQINVTFVLGVSDVLLELDNANQSMSLVSPDIYSTTVLASEVGSIPFRIYMESSLGTWSVTTGWLHVLSGTSTTTASSENQTDLLPFLAIGGVAVTVVVAGAVALRRKRATQPES